ncbi:MAG: hypothetical protein KDE26_26170, partial [Bacteroidetes bacterium]|nr:hypothetical protein [Bacteroidota bacterium]
MQLKLTILSAFLIIILSDLHPQQDRSFDALQYRYVGPTRGGRVTTVTGVTSQPNVFYMGSTGGGLWKTTDYGTT